MVSSQESQSQEARTWTDKRSRMAAVLLPLLLSRPPPSVSPEQSYHSVVRRPPRRPSWQHPTCSNLALFFLVNVHTDSSPVSTGVPYNLFCQLGLFNLMLFRPSFHLHVPIFGFAFGLARSFESARF